MSHRRTVAATATLTALLAAACGGVATTATTGPDKPADSAAGAAAATVDLQFDYDAVALPGTVYAPAAMDRPDMLLGAATRKLPLDKQRAAFKKAKPATKNREAQILATMLYQESQKLTDDAARLAMLGEARKVLADALAQVGPEMVDVVLFHNLACLSFELDDLEGAAAALEGALAFAPDDVGAPERRAFRAYYLLRAGRVADAAAYLAGVTPSKDQPELAYVLAWTALRSGDLPRARGAMLEALRGWKREYSLRAVIGDAALFAGLTGASRDEAVAFAEAMVVYTKAEPGDASAKARTDALGNIQSAVARFGGLTEAVALIDAMIASRQPSPVELVRMRLGQADAARILGEPGAVAARAAAAVDALVACGEACAAKERELTTKLVFTWARLSANIYATTQDERWYLPAKTLYKTYLGIPGIPDATTVEGELAMFESNRTSIMAGKVKDGGRHDKAFTQFGLDGRRAEVLACYERALQLDPAVAGSLVVRMEVAATGEVAGVATEPAGGEAGLAAVAACVADRARGWSLPSRATPGVTRIGLAFELAPVTK